MLTGAGEMGEEGLSVGNEEVGIVSCWFVYFPGGAAAGATAFWVQQ